MNLFLTNDDGIDAPGIKALEQAIQGLGSPLIAAPAGPMSECSHTVTTREPIRVEERGVNRFAIHGSPADCVRLGVSELFRDKGPLIILSGINHGGNLGADIFMSGTVAAAREAALLGHRAIATSHYVRRGIELDWQVAAQRIRRVLEVLLHEQDGDGEFWNVNLPHLDPGSSEPAVVTTSPSRKPMPVRYTRDGQHFQYVGPYAERAFEVGSDIDHCFGGRISVSKLRL